MITIVIAGITAIIEIDIKKIIALSTLRQLGIIILILGSVIQFYHFFSFNFSCFLKAILFII